MAKYKLTFQVVIDATDDHWAEFTAHHISEAIRGDGRNGPKLNVEVIIENKEK